MKERGWLRRWGIGLLAVLAALMLSGGVGAEGTIRSEARQTQVVFPVPGEWTRRDAARKTRVKGYKVRSWRSQVSFADNLDGKSS